VSQGLLLLSFLAAANACRTRLALPQGGLAIALGSLAALATVAALAETGRALIDALEISPESFRLATGLVLALEGARSFLVPRPAAEPELGGLLAAIVPVLFPLLLQPGVVTLAVAAGGDDVAGTAIGAFALALVPLGVLAALPAGPRGSALLVAGARLIGALETVAGVALSIDAIRDV
jgi:small neutral amino acid transporter SnatA (MarC family)